RAFALRPPYRSFMPDNDGAGLRSRAHTADKGLEPAASTRWFFSFAVVGPGDLLALPLRPLVSRCDRFRRPGKSSGPPPFAPSLNVQRDDTHNNSGFSVI